MNEQFNKTYHLPPGKQTNKGIEKKQNFIESEQIRLQQEMSQRPEVISWYEKQMYASHPEKSEKIRVGIFCNMIPAEIIYAMGGEPIRLDCGNGAMAQLGEEKISGEVCPLAKASLGTLLQEGSLASSCDIFVVPTSCDAKKKMAEFLSDYKPTFALNLPPEQSIDRFQTFAFEEIKRLVSFLQKHLPQKLNKKALLHAVQISQRKTSLARKLQELRIEEPRKLSIRDLFLVIQTVLFHPVDPVEWIDKTESLIAELEKLTFERKNLRPRLILTGAPIVWPNFKILNVLEESGADIIADTVCTGVQALFDPIIIDEKNEKSLLRALTNRYIFAAICPCFISQETRLNRIIDLTETTKADGIVNYSLRLCQLFDMENYRLERIVKGKKISVFTIRTDYSLEDTEQIRVRVEAFLETL